MVSVDVKHHVYLLTVEVSNTELNTVRLVTVPVTINETLKWITPLPILMQESFWW